MQLVWVGTLCLLVCALRFSEGAAAAPGTEACGAVLTSYSPTTLNKIYIAPVMAQGFQVIDRSRLFNITTSFFTVAKNGSALVSAELYSDASGNGTATVPGSPLTNATFAVAEEVFYAYPDVYAGHLEERTFQSDEADGIHLQAGYYWLVISMPSSMGWGINIVGPRDTFQPVVLSNMARSLNDNLTHWVQMSHTALVTFNGCYVVRPSPSPSSSPSPSIAPAIAPITVNVTASFDGQQPTVNVSAPIGSAPASGGSGAAPTTTVTASLGDLQVGNTSISLQDGGFEVRQKNATVPGASSTYVYTARLDNATTLEHSYTFHSKQQQVAFEGMPFTITPSSLKWSVNLTILGDESSSLMAEGFTLQYQLAGLVTSGDGAAIPANGFRVGAKSNWPQTSMTTYVLPLSTLVAAQLQVFDVALVDDVLVPLQHQVKLVSNPPVASSAENETSESTAVYVLQLTFPPVNRSLFYDPSLGLGVLLGAPGGKGSGSDNSGLLIGVAVAVPVAILFVATVVIVGFSFMYWRKKRNARNLRHRLSTVHSRLQNNSKFENDDL